MYLTYLNLYEITFLYLVSYLLGFNTIDLNDANNNWISVDLFLTSLYNF